MKIVATIVLWSALGVLSLGFVARPHFVERWALYLGSESMPKEARLFLDPFPNAISCESRVRLLRSNNENAFCAGHREVAFGSHTDIILAADYQRILFGSAYCAPRRTAKALQRSGS